MKIWQPLGAALFFAMIAACGDDDESTAVELSERPQLVNQGYLSFPLTVPGETASTVVPIGNYGREQLVISSITGGGQDQATFAIGEPSATTISARDAMSIPVSFTPPEEGAYFSTVTIISNAENFPTFIVDLLGPAGDRDSPSLHIAEKSLAIAIPAGEERQRGVIRYYNVGRESLVVTGYAFGGASPGSFALADGTTVPGGPCTANGLECADGLFCRLENAQDENGTCALSTAGGYPIVLDIYYSGAGSQQATFSVIPLDGAAATIPLSGSRL